MSTPYAYEVDDSETFSPFLTKDAAYAEKRRAAGKRVVNLFACADDLAQPGPRDRADSARAQMIVKDAEAMAAIRRLRELSGCGMGVTLSGVADAIERKLSEGARA